jgi:hypothetical protein
MHICGGALVLCTVVLYVHCAKNILLILNKADVSLSHRMWSGSCTYLEAHKRPMV